VVCKPAGEKASIEENEDAKRSTCRDKLLLISTTQHKRKEAGKKEKMTRSLA
jgi:hypothetical protein